MSQPHREKAINFLISYQLLAQHTMDFERGRHVLFLQQTTGAYKFCPRVSRVSSPLVKALTWRIGLTHHLFYKYKNSNPWLNETLAHMLSRCGPHKD